MRYLFFYLLEGRCGSVTEVYSFCASNNGLVCFRLCRLAARTLLARPYVIGQTAWLPSGGRERPVASLVERSVTGFSPRPFSTVDEGLFTVCFGFTAF